MDKKYDIYYAKSINENISIKEHTQMVLDSYHELLKLKNKYFNDELNKMIEKTRSTVLIVGQRIASIMSANQIIVLDEGKIVGKGTHDELMKNCKVYQEIAYSQLSKEELGHE